MKIFVFSFALVMCLPAFAQNRLCLDAGHYLRQNADGTCPQAPACAEPSNYAACNPVLFPPGTCAPRSANNTTGCIERSAGSIGDWMRSLTDQQRQQIQNSRNDIRAYFEQERRTYRPGQRKNPNDVEADRMYTRFLNLDSFIASGASLRNVIANQTSSASGVDTSQAVGVNTSQVIGVNQSGPVATTSAACTGPSAAEFQGCDANIRESIARELNGACQLILIEAERRNSRRGELTTFEWNSQTRRYVRTTRPAARVSFGRGGLAYGNEYFQMAPRTDQRMEPSRGQTPIGIYGGLAPISSLVPGFRCVTDPGSQYYNMLADSSVNIGQSANDPLQYPYALMIRYPAFNAQPAHLRNGACLLIHANDDRSCAERGCLSTSRDTLNSLSGWVNWQRDPAIAILTRNERRNLNTCVPGLGASVAAPAAQHPAAVTQ